MNKIKLKLKELRLENLLLVITIMLVLIGCYYLQHHIPSMGNGYRISLQIILGFTALGVGVRFVINKNKIIDSLCPKQVDNLAFYRLYYEYSNEGKLNILFEPLTGSLASYFVFIITFVIISIYKEEYTIDEKELFIGIAYPIFLLIFGAAKSWFGADSDTKLLKLLKEKVEEKEAGK